jgi:glycerol-3-phosphate acyltransferase PlsY
MSGFLTLQNGVMLAVFAVFLVPALFSRRMERSDYVTLVVMPVVTFLTAVLPGIVMWGFDKEAATYVLGLVVVIGVATLNFRSASNRRALAESEPAKASAEVEAVQP